MKHKLLFKSLFVWSVLYSCGVISPLNDTNSSSIDAESPELLAYHWKTQSTILLEYSEEVKIDFENSFCQGAEISGLAEYSEKHELNLMHDLAIGEEVLVHLDAWDRAGNSSWAQFPLYIPNPQPAQLRFNELTVNGSSSRPDLLEFLVLEEGYIGGFSLYEGMPEEHESIFIFPNCWVDKNEFILVHLYPEGSASEIQETESLDSSDGIDAMEDVRDFWCHGWNGVSASNGLLTLSQSPYDQAISALPYSNRYGADRERYQGFGTKKVGQWMEALSLLSIWQYSEDQIYPEDCIQSDNSSSTRSLFFAGEDSKSKDSWFTSATRGSSFGRENDNPIYIP
jgi:hypothetical protein